MSTVNKVTVLGRLGADPEARFTAGGDKVCNLSLATTEVYKKEEHTEWHRVVLFGKAAEIADEYLKKGDLVYIEGSLRTNKWTDKSGIERHTTQIIAREMKMVSTKRSPKPELDDTQTPDVDSGIPF